MATKITNKLLKEAIADAEAVRETAVANAKLVLEEAITPQIQSMIARRLRVEADMAHDEKEEEKEETPTVKKESAVATHETAKEEPFEDGEAVGGKDFPADTSAIGGGDNKEPSDDAFDTSAVGDGGENKEDSHTDWYDDWSESDFDLNEIIAELEADIAALSEGESEEEDEDKEMVDEVSHETEDKDVQKFAKAPVTEEETEEKEEEGEEKGGMEKTADMEKDMEKKDDEEEISLEAILRELENDEEEDMNDAGAMQSPDKKGELKAKLDKVQNELLQYQEAVRTLRERLQEVNLLNAKLLFTNKLFKKEGLNNDQKIRIVESFDRATTVREVKLVYTALVENLSVAAKTFNASRKKVVAEGFASKATRTTAPKSEVIVENTVAKRLQQLAGII